MDLSWNQFRRLHDDKKQKVRPPARLFVSDEVQAAGGDVPAAKKKTIEAAQARRGAFAKSGAAGRASALAARRGF